jgi:chloramphenicol O-acetyltransferase type A
MPRMSAQELDLSTWPRRASFEFYRQFDKPYFNICVRVDVAPLRQAVKHGGTGSLMLACHWLTLDLAHRIAPFRYRLHQGRVRVLSHIVGSAATLQDDGSLGFAHLHHAPSYAAFVGPAQAAIAAVRAGQVPFDATPDEQAQIHFTTLPWLHFTSFSHARNWGREDSVPKVSFGRVLDEGSRAWMPLSVEVHHALMDGVSVGEFVQGFEAAAADPLWVSAG